MEGLQSSTGSSPHRRGASLSRWSAACWFHAAIIAILTGGILYIWIWHQHSEERAIRALPDAERKALYQRTLADLESVCARPHASNLDDHCRDQAEFILQFPECDAACGRLARSQLAHPTR
jgi:hypothetical protein